MKANLPLPMDLPLPDDHPFREWELEDLLGPKDEPEMDEGMVRCSCCKQGEWPAYTTTIDGNPVCWDCTDKWEEGS